MARTALRRRLLAINPFFWLAGRQRVSAPIFMLLTTILVLITVWVASPYFRWLFRSETASPVMGSLFAWMWTGLAIHALVLYYGAIVASQRLAEDKQVGALELVLVTPTSERAIARGLWLAYWRRMFFPSLFAVLVHCFFVWQIMTMAVLDPPGKLPPYPTAGEIFWGALLDQPVRGYVLEWGFVLAVRIVLLLLVALAASWVMLGWVGRWLGLRMKHPGFAPMTAVVLTLVPPILLFSLLCYVCGKWHFFRLPERQWLPLLMWAGFGIALANSILLSLWAAIRLRRDFRTTVTGRYETPALRDRWRLGWRILLRFAAATTALALALALIALLFYAYQNSRGQRRWAAFQEQLKQRGESLDLSAIPRASVPAAEDFAQTAAFQNLLKRSPTNDPAALFTKSFGQITQNRAPGSAAGTLTFWMQQNHTDFNVYFGWIVNPSGRKPDQNREISAADVWEGLQPLQAHLQAVALAAQLPYFEPMTNRQAAAVLQTSNWKLSTMEQLHFLFLVRACALLALDRADEAGADVLTGLRLVQLARQSPDRKSSSRVQTLLVNSLQPVWEGLAGHRWTESQLAAFQMRLAQFDLLSDHTNVIRRVALAYVETWRSIPTTKKGHGRVTLPPGAGPNFERPDGGWQPRAWWYDNCIQLYQAGQNAIARVDVAAGRVGENNNWSDLEGLPVDGEVFQLFQQNQWMGNAPGLVSFAQTAVNQAIIACALERYRLVHGSYPEGLDQLVPGFLANIPRDISRGRPMFYLWHDHNNYELRGAGANQTIEQGKATSDDWVWAFTSPTNMPPIKAPKRK